ncbi:MAG: MFS transporter [Bacteroidetes bacterium]|nr:MFS transporter [Bacteroidota bacterium]
MTDMQPEVKKTGMPAAVPYIIGNEAAERFSFYGIRAIMTTFLVAQFFNPTQNPELQAVAEAKSNELSHLFVTLAYFMPLVGGILADWFLGKYRVILYVSMLYAAGNLMVALNTENLSLFSLGLIMIAVAAGGIKSCVSANVGDQFDKSNEHLLSKMYGWFYFTINTGSIVATALIPLIYKHYGAKIAFGIPGILMVVATVIFWMGRDKYVRVPPSGYKRENFISITSAAIWEGILSVFRKKPVVAEAGNTFWVELGKKYQFSESAIDGVQAVYRILMIFAFTPIFWALWDQNLSEWVLQAAKLDRNLFGYELLTEQVQTFNPIFLVGMIPVFTYFIFPAIEKAGLKVTPLKKIGAGLVLTALTFVIIALLQEKIDQGFHPSVIWQILAYLILAAAEVLVSVTCLEYAYTHSPKSMKSTMSALYLLGISAGNLFVSLVNNSISNGGFFSHYTGARYYWLFFGIMCGFIVLYMLVSRRLPEKRYVGMEESTEA